MDVLKFCLGLKWHIPIQIGLVVLPILLPAFSHLTPDQLEAIKTSCQVVQGLGVVKAYFEDPNRCPKP